MWGCALGLLEASAQMATYPGKEERTRSETTFIVMRDAVGVLEWPQLRPALFAPVDDARWVAVWRITAQSQ